ncbi:hypothetical protein NDU88_009150 [Pleurodeles waltl]|uniref:Uncharacterized protein n=1 Tax=Pleurodeles waltl TaxID=8319 RepID=A0AAV7RXQ7_PLEWA|nr:hypothetical protein NDU88_009150 [Pleurodeles waltl]
MLGRTQTLAYDSQLADLRGPTDKCECEREFSSDLYTPLTIKPIEGKLDGIKLKLRMRKKTSCVEFSASLSNNVI